MMVNGCQTVPLGEFLTQRKEFFTIDDFTRYKRARVQLHGKGIVLRDEVDGAEVKTKEQQGAHIGEFLVAEIDAKVGGFCINQDHFEHQSQTRLANSLGDSPGIDKPWCGRSLYSGRNSLTRACKPATSCQDLLRSHFLNVRTNLSAIPFVSGR